MRILRILTVCLMLGFGLLNTASAEFKLVSSDPNMGDQFWLVSRHQRAYG